MANEPVILNVYDMTMPYNYPLYAGIMPGLEVTIVGKPIPDTNRFHVDFIKGPDIAFHFNPRFDQQTVVRNSLLNGQWEKEQKDGGFPFVRGQRFELKILVESDAFKVSVDGTHLLYKHKVSELEEVTMLQVVGDVIISSVDLSMK